MVERRPVPRSRGEHGVVGDVEAQAQKAKNEKKQTESSQTYRPQARNKTPQAPAREMCESVTPLTSPAPLPAMRRCAFEIGRRKLKRICLPLTDT